MSNDLATDARTPKLATRYYLETTKDGIPINKQIPQSYQVYNGNGNETIDYTGENTIVINTNINAGTLNINIGGTLQQNINVYKRKLLICLLQPIANTIVLNYGVGTIILGGYGPVGNTYTLITNSIGSVIVLFPAIDKAIVNVSGIMSSTIVNVFEGFCVGLLNDAIVTQADDIIPFDTAAIPGGFNTGLFDTVTHTCTIPTTGKYIVSVLFAYEVLNNNVAREIQIRLKNNNVVIRIFVLDYPATLSTPTSGSFSGEIELNQNDVLQLNTFQGLDFPNQIVKSGINTIWSVKRIP